MNIHRRKMGTGSACCVKGNWHAYGPEHKGKRVHLRGGFKTRGEAERFLDRWLAEQQQRAA